MKRLLLFMTVPAAFILSDLNGEISGSLLAGYESRHIYRGVDSALEGSIQWTLAQINYGQAYGGVWYGTGPNTSYEEVDLYGGYIFTSGAWRIIPNFIWYHFPTDDSADSTDIMLRLESDFLYNDLLTITPQFIYSFNLDADGHYLEAGAILSYVLNDHWLLSLRPAISVSSGLRPEDGFDHAELIARLRYRLNEAFAIEGFAGYTCALEAVDPIDGNELWSGLTLSASF